jgi:hypothetical protein
VNIQFVLELRKLVHKVWKMLDAVIHYLYSPNSPSAMRWRSTVPQISLS